VLRTVFIVLNATLSALLTLGVFRGLPVRNGIVDGFAGLLICGFATTSLSLALKTPWSLRVARFVSYAALVLGTVTMVLLMFSMSWLAGVTGSVGLGGVVLAALILALLFPYLIVFPLLQLAWIRRV
jgi:hypothetical protein